MQSGSKDSQGSEQKQRTIVLRPEPSLAQRIDEARRKDKRSAPNWILKKLEELLPAEVTTGGGK